MANTTGKKFGGRTKGTPNKTTEEIRESFQELISGNLDKLKEDLEGMEAEKRVKYVIELAKFVVPTLRATDLSTSADMAPVIISLGRGIDPNAD